MALTTGVWQAATARISDSSENGSRSSIDPPPRAMIITSTARSASSRRSASVTSPTAYGPCTAAFSTRNRTAGHRRAALRRTSRSAADSRPQMRPTTPGRNGNGRFLAAAKSPSAASDCRSRSSRASSSPIPTARTSMAVRAKAPRLMLKSGFAQTTTRAPSAGAGSLASSTARGHTTRTDTAATGSRKVRKTTAPRRVSSAIWPSTQILPSRPSHSPTSRSTVRTGTGDSAEFASAMTACPAGPPARRRSGLAALDLGNTALEHGQHRGPGRVGALIIDQGAQLSHVETAHAGPQRRHRQLVIAGNRQVTGRRGGGRGLGGAGSRCRGGGRRGSGGGLGGAGSRCGGGGRRGSGGGLGGCACRCRVSGRRGSGGGLGGAGSRCRGGGRGGGGGGLGGAGSSGRGGGRGRGGGGLGGAGSRCRGGGRRGSGGGLGGAGSGWGTGRRGGGRGRRGGGGRRVRPVGRPVPDPVRDEQNLADPGEHGPQRVCRGLLHAFGDLRDAHIDPSSCKRAAAAGHHGSPAARRASPRG